MRKLKNQLIRVLEWMIERLGDKSTVEIEDPKPKKVRKKKLKRG